MVHVPEGPFLMGADERDGQVGLEVGVDSMPRHQRDVAAFSIDRYEVTHEDYRAFVRATDRAAPTEPRFADFYAWEKGDYPGGMGNHPVVYVDWNDGHDYCAWNGKRLPTEAEWEKAARGTDGRTLPWNGPYEETRCNTLETQLGWSTPVGAVAGDVSPYGVFDMCGNVSEWTADWYKAYPGSTLERASFGEKYRVTRGGSWKLEVEPYARVTNRTLAFKPDKRHRAIGFRCAVSEAPEARSR